MTRNRRRKSGFIATLMVCMMMILTMAMPVFAAAPKIKKIEYEGGGRVDVDFSSKVNYKYPKVTVKDSSGKSYSAKIVDRDSDDMDFKVSNYVKGKTYTFTISGIKKLGSSGSYSKVSGKFTIPAAKKASNEIAASKAKTIAIDSAVKNYKINRNTIIDFEIERDTYKGKNVWEVSFKARKSGKTWYELEFEIERSTGKVLYREIEVD